MKIVVVDDATFIRSILKDIFSSLGHHVIAEFSNAKDLINNIENLDADLLTMDITMPDIDGITATRIVKNLKPDLKVIVISAITVSHIEEEAINCGANEFIQKPFSRDRIVQTVKRIESELVDKN
ncbi:response regulator [Caldicellulosiruptoraceae bacterium PP1]